MHTMPTSKVTRGYQVTIPAEVRSRAGIRVGDKLVMEYDDSTKIIKIRSPSKSRKTMKLGKDVSLQEIDRAIAKGFEECLQS